MNTVKVIAPEGQDNPGSIHQIPEEDLQGFLDNGWTLAEEKAPKKNK